MCVCVVVCSQQQTQRPGMRGVRTQIPAGVFYPGFKRVTGVYLVAGRVTGRFALCPDNGSTHPARSEPTNLLSHRDICGMCISPYLLAQHAVKYNLRGTRRNVAFYDFFFFFSPPWPLTSAIVRPGGCCCVSRLFTDLICPIPEGHKHPRVQTWR